MEGRVSIKFHYSSSREKTLLGITLRNFFGLDFNVRVEKNADVIEILCQNTFNGMREGVENNESRVVNDVNGRNTLRWISDWKNFSFALVW